MLELTVGGTEAYNEETNEFVNLGGVKIQLEHSLASMSKWESLFEKPFLGDKDFTDKETLKYIECMITTPDFPPGVVSDLMMEHYRAIDAYINSKHSATWVNDNSNNKSNEVITSELIYYWMYTANIPIECESWNINRLFTLLRVFNAKNAPDDKKNKRKWTAADRQALNEKRRKELNTKG